MFAIVPDNEGTVDYFLNTNNNNGKNLVSISQRSAGGFFFYYALRLA